MKPRTPALLLVALLTSFTASTGLFAKDVQVKEFTRKDGTVVKAHTRQTKDKAADTAADKAADKAAVKGYTKKDGTVVKGYSRKKAAKTK